MSVLESLAAVGNTVKTAFKNQSSNLLVASAVVGTVVLAYFVAEETPEVNEKLESAKKDKGEDLTTVEKAMIVVPGYRKSELAGAYVIFAIIAAHKCDLDKIAVYSSACGLANDRLEKLQKKVEDELGPNKTRKIKDSIREDYIRSNPPVDACIESTGKGTTLCCDAYSGRYFYSSPEAIRRAQADALVNFNFSGYLSLNDWYDLLRIDTVKLGDRLGWCNSRDIFDIEFTSTLTGDDRPVLVIEFAVDPIPDYIDRY